MQIMQFFVDEPVTRQFRKIMPTGISFRSTQKIFHALF